MYRALGDKGFRYDKELALLWSIYGEMSVRLQVTVNDNRLNFRQYETRFLSKGGKIEVGPIRMSGTDATKNFTLALRASADTDFFRPDARRLLLTRLNDSFQSFDSKNQRRFRGTLLWLVEQESESEAKGIYQRMLEKTES
ncbi:MAG: hypothetical protein KDM64_18495 [Verrucomicrobiae bacterium]|nr:hypothetical protein [Verrucomicrobiae bacterium]